RPKDWMDVEQVLYTRETTFDSEYVPGWISEMLGADSERLQRFDTLVANAAAPGMRESIIKGLSTSLDHCEDTPWGSPLAHRLHETSPERREAAGQSHAALRSPSTH
ncbi:MAG: hypothetical protein ABI939_06915, partial [Anaerolineaceae bacterium]